MMQRVSACLPPPPIQSAAAGRSASQLIASSPPSYRDHPFHYAISYSIHVVMYINDNEGIVWHNLQPLAQTEPFL